MATVQWGKGLEFDHVSLASRLDDMDKVAASEQAKQRRALLYVVAIRDAPYLTKRTHRVVFDSMSGLSGQIAYRFPAVRRLTPRLDSVREPEASSQQENNHSSDGRLPLHGHDLFTRSAIHGARQESYFGCEFLPFLPLPFMPIQP
jgi:hypothetical protein